eukprot:93057-Prymnesium_polylepis.1
MWGVGGPEWSAWVGELKIRYGGHTHETDGRDGEPSTGERNDLTSQPDGEHRTTGGALRQHHRASDAARPTSPPTGTGVTLRRHLLVMSSAM